MLKGIFKRSDKKKAKELRFNQLTINSVNTTKVDRIKLIGAVCIDSSKIDNDNSSNFKSFCNEINKLGVPIQILKTIKSFEKTYIITEKKVIEHVTSILTKYYGSVDTLTEEELKQIIDEYDNNSAEIRTRLEKTLK